MEKKARIHRTLAEPVIENLKAIFNENKMADKVIEKTLKLNPKWGARDRAFIASNTYEIVRWWRLIKFCGSIDQRKITDTETYWQTLGVWLVLSDFELPPWPEFQGLDPTSILKLKVEAQNIRKVRESVPDWLDELGEKELGEHWDAELAAMNKEAEVFLRVNTLRTDRDELQKLLAIEGISTTTVEGVESALRLAERKNVFKSTLFQKGFFEVQDAGSQLIADFVEVEPGMRVIDACAGAGGKSLHLAQIMQNKGKLIAMDVADYKLKELKKRAARDGVDNIETRLIDAKAIKRLKEKADRLLLDVPCSGLGVLKRNPDAKWKMKPDFIAEIKDLQVQILTDYTTMLKPGGILVYATCSLLYSENEHQVKAFLRANPQFSLIEEKRISPAKHGFDGFYMAKMKKRQ